MGKAVIGVTDAIQALLDVKSYLHECFEEKREIGLVSVAL